MSRIVARLLGAGLGLTLAASVQASPKGYDIDRLLRQEAPKWLHGPAAAPAPIPMPQYQQPPLAAPQPLDRIPRMPAPAVLPEDSALAVPPPLPTPQRNYDVQQPQHTIRGPSSPRSTVSGAWTPLR